MNSNILIVEDDSSARIALAKALGKMGHQIFQASNGEDGLEYAQTENIHLLLCDIKLPGIDGLEVLRRFRKIRPNAVVIMMTAFGTVERAVKAIKMGAMDFIEKPLELEIIRNLVKTAVKQPTFYQDRKQVIENFRETNFFEGMIACSRTMHEVFETIIKVASARTTVLITGETGTGKELVARAIHNYSQREGPFIPVNLSALPDTLIESELFGHVKGAHSTAFKERKGRLTEADHGTLFLDEIGDTPENIQVKLLRVIESRNYERLGENISRKVDVRFIAATNVNLEEAVESGKFRQDLYYRLKVLRIELPPLRQHPEDIELLVNAFVDKYSKENQRSINKVDKDTLYILNHYLWPGNVRELERVVETAVIMADGDTLLPNHLPREIQNTDTPKDVITFPIGSSLKDVEQEMIRHTLIYVGGNKTKAAEILGIGTRTLYRKIEEYGL